MDIHIQLADMRYIDSCIEILQNSDLGKAYFSNHEKAANMLTYAVGQENVYVALDENEKCLGYKCVGELPDFYKKGTNCYLMMKRRG